MGGQCPESDTRQVGRSRLDDFIRDCTAWVRKGEPKDREEVVESLENAQTGRDPSIIASFGRRETGAVCESL